MVMEASGDGSRHTQARWTTVLQESNSASRSHRQVRTTNRFLRPANGQSQSRHRRDSTNTTARTAYTSPSWTSRAA